MKSRSASKPPRSRVDKPVPHVQATRLIRVYISDSPHDEVFCGEIHEALGLPIKQVSAIMRELDPTRTKPRPR